MASNQYSKVFSCLVRSSLVGNIRFGIARPSHFSDEKSLRDEKLYGPVIVRTAGHVMKSDYEPKFRSSGTQTISAISDGVRVMGNNLQFSELVRSDKILRT